MPEGSVGGPRWVIRPDAVPLQTNLRQGNGKNLCTIAVRQPWIESTLIQDLLVLGKLHRLGRGVPVLGATQTGAASGLALLARVIGKINCEHAKRKSSLCI